MLAHPFVTLLLSPHWAYCSSDYTRPLRPSPNHATVTNMSEINLKQFSRNVSDEESQFHLTEHRLVLLKRANFPLRIYLPATQF